jgi:hypothetical protein
MSGDYSRRRFDPQKHYTSVLMQQGRVQLDADWNEMAELFERRFRAERVDTFGRAAVPRTGPGQADNARAFEVSRAGGELRLGRGRMYVDGLLAENHGPAAAPQILDPVLDELHGGDDLPFKDQPYFSGAPLPPGERPFLVFLDVWRREVTSLEDPALVEPAIGVDTTTRMQTAWQARFFSDPALTLQSTAADIAALASWQALIRPSGARLTVATGALVPGEVDPCILPPGGGFRSLENQLYRVEIHRGGALDDPDPARRPTFKWSRDNASVASAVLGVRDDILVLATLGRDAVLRFREGDWVEVSDDLLEAQRAPGILARIVHADDDERTIQLHASLADLVAARADLAFFATDPPISATRHLRVRRWDQSGPVLTDKHKDGDPPLVDLRDNTSGGVIPVPADAFVVLEHGIKIQLTRDGGEFHVGDHWTFAARASDGSVEPQGRAPPQGDHHHFALLALVDPKVAKPTDLRTIFPPAGDGSGGCCTIHLTADEHNGGKTIQQQLDSLRARGGGTLCLDAGVYRLLDAVQIDGARNITVRGQGRHTVLARQFKPLAQPEPNFSDLAKEVDKELVLDEDKLLEVGGRHAVFRVANTRGFTLADVTVLSAEDTYFARYQNCFVNCVDLRVERCAFVVTSPPLTAELRAEAEKHKNPGELCHAAIVLHKVLVGAVLRDNAFLARVGVAGVRVMTADFRLEGNFFQDSLISVALAGWFPAQTARIVDNRFVGVLGMLVSGASAGATVEIRGNHFDVLRAGIQAGIGDVAISDNTILGNADSRVPLELADAPPAVGDPIGIEIGSGASPAPQQDIRIERNTLRHLGTGIRINAACERAQIVDNHLEHLAFTGISAESTSSDELVITGNTVRDIALEHPTGAVHGIVVRNAISVRVERNTLERLGPLTEGWPQSTSIVRAISVENCIDLHVHNNEIHDCGPRDVADGRIVHSVALYLRHVHGILECRANRVARRNFANTRHSVIALFVQQSPHFGDPVITAVPGPGDRQVILFGDRTRPLPAPPAAWIADNYLATLWNHNVFPLLDELIADGAPRPGLPLVVEIDAPLRFADNQISLLAASKPQFEGVQIGYMRSPRLSSTFNTWVNLSGETSTFVQLESQRLLIFGDTYEAMNTRPFTIGPPQPRDGNQNVVGINPFTTTSFT